MTVKHKNIFLFLALACFVGIILIFVFDGYIGVYDRLVMDNHLYLQTVEYDQAVPATTLASSVAPPLARLKRPNAVPRMSAQENFLIIPIEYSGVNRYTLVKPWVKNYKINLLGTEMIKDCIIEDH